MACTDAVGADKPPWLHRKKAHGQLFYLSPRNPVAMSALRKDRHVVVATVEVGDEAVTVAVSPDGTALM